ncbi:MAG: hypothetical protein JWR05_3571 [Mucilaginibacter sp.]|nr:hypothetical protein [Mucilaginibacter sp.]
MKIFKIAALTALLIFCMAYLVNGQKKDSLAYYTKQLNWDSFGVISNYATSHMIFDKSSESIINILKDKKTEGKYLLSIINEEQKAVAIHAILTKLFDPKKFNISYRSMFNKGPKGGILYNDIVGNKFSLNGVSWELKFGDTTKYSIDSLEILKIKNYWSKRLLAYKR